MPGACCRRPYSSLPTVSRARVSHCDHWARRPCSFAWAKAALAYGRATVARSAIFGPGAPASGPGGLDLARELLDQICVRLRIDLALEQTRSARHGQRAHVLAKLVARAGLLECRFLASVTHQPLSLGHRGRARFLDDFARTPVGLVDDLERLLTRFVDDDLRLAVRALQLLVAAFSGGKTVGDLGAAVVDRTDQRWPDELHRHPAEDDKDDALDEESCVEVHCFPGPRSGRAAHFVHAAVRPTPGMSRTDSFNPQRTGWRSRTRARHRRR